MPSSESPAAVSAEMSPAAVQPHRWHSGHGIWRRLAVRLSTRFWLKAGGTTVFMWLFFVGYFHLLRHPLQPPLEMPLTAVDGAVGFHAWALWPYVSLWVYVALPPALMPSARELIRYGWWVGGLCIAGLACFTLWPTSVPPQAMPAGHDGFELLRGVDAAGNACPSMHVAAATFSALWIDRLARDLVLPAWLRGASIGWFALIVWSTLAIKQHVWWDVLAGLLLALAIGVPSLRGWVVRQRGDRMPPR